jgi:hypothetical protein
MYLTSTKVFLVSQPMNCNGRIIIVITKLMSGSKHFIKRVVGTDKIKLKSFENCSFFALVDAKSKQHQKMFLFKKMQFNFCFEMSKTDQ